LGWNKITGPGSEGIANIMKADSHLRVLDLCWNGLGQGLMQPGEVGKTLGEAIKENNSIIHFDISFNRIGAQDTKEIGRGLHYNSTMFGFHFRGNSGKVDSLGFLKTAKQEGQPQIISD